MFSNLNRSRLIFYFCISLPSVCDLIKTEHDNSFKLLKKKSKFLLTKNKINKHKKRSVRLLSLRII